MAIAAVLSVREHQVMDLVTTGLTSRKIGVRLGLATRTVETHIYRARVKLGVTNRTSAVVRLVRHSVLPQSIEHGGHKDVLYLRNADEPREVGELVYLGRVRCGDDVLHVYERRSPGSQPSEFVSRETRKEVRE